MAITKTKTKAAGPATKGLRIVARPPTFRRAGFTFTAEAQTIPLSDLSDEQVALLQSEANLVVSEVDIPAPADSTTTAEAAK